MVILRTYDAWFLIAFASLLISVKQHVKTKNDDIGRWMFVRDTFRSSPGYTGAPVCEATPAEWTRCLLGPGCVTMMLLLCFPAQHIGPLVTSQGRPIRKEYLVFFSMKRCNLCYLCLDPDRQRERETDTDTKRERERDKPEADWLLLLGL